MSNIMLSKSPPVEKPLHPELAAGRPTMENTLSKLGARLGKMIDDLSGRSKEVGHSVGNELRILGKRFKAAWGKMFPALVHARDELFCGCKEAVKAWQNPGSESTT